jgi:hypothetical protein
LTNLLCSHGSKADPLLMLRILRRRLPQNYPTPTGPVRACVCVCVCVCVCWHVCMCVCSHSLAFILLIMASAHVDVQVSLAPILGLFCSYTRSLLLLYSVQTSPASRFYGCGKIDSAVIPISCRQKKKL